MRCTMPTRSSGRGPVSRRPPTAAARRRNGRPPRHGSARRCARNGRLSGFGPRDPRRLQKIVPKPHVVQWRRPSHDTVPRVDATVTGLRHRRSRGPTRYRSNGYVPSSTPTPSGLALEQVDELQRLQRRILHGSTLVRYVLAAEQRSGQTLTMGDALAEVLADITEDARSSGTILQQVGNGRPPTTAQKYDGECLRD